MQLALFEPRDGCVVHCRRAPFDVYVGRTMGPFTDVGWGNPFHVLHENQRADVIRRYREWLFDQPALVERARRELRGKVLGCWCAPRACHGDVLAEIANAGVSV